MKRQDGDNNLPCQDTSDLLHGSDGSKRPCPSEPTAIGCGALGAAPSRAEEGCRHPALSASPGVMEAVLSACSGAAQHLHRKPEKGVASP